MARLMAAKCRLCRREGLKLFLKGTRCESAKCAFTKRDYPPGKRSWRHARPSDYALQLREKQKVKRYYGLSERQFRAAFERAAKTRGNTGMALLSMLERRLDNVLFLSGLATSRPGARQLIAHGHVLLNGHRAKTASQVLKSDDVATLCPAEGIQKLVTQCLEMSKSRTRPGWIEVVEQPPSVRVIAAPSRDEISVPTEEQLIVELLSK
jgi:small subunit ribosomal protein S4